MFRIIKVPVKIVASCSVEFNRSPVRCSYFAKEAVNWFCVFSRVKLKWNANTEWHEVSIKQDSTVTPCLTIMQWDCTRQHLGHFIKTYQDPLSDISLRVDTGIRDRFDLRWTLFSITRAGMKPWNSIPLIR